MTYSKYVSLGYDKQGNRIRKHVTARSKIELEAKVYDTKRKFEDTPHYSLISFYDYSRKWLDTYKSSRELATKEMYEVALRKTKDIYVRKLVDVKSIDLQMIINKNANHPDACHKLSLFLKQVFKRAVKDGIIKFSPAEDLELPKKEKKGERGLTEDEKKKIKEAKLTDMERIYVGLLFYLGLRPQEAFPLMISDFDFNEKIVKIRKAVTYQNNKAVVKATKTYIARNVPIPSVFLKEVKSYVKRIAKENRLYLLSLDSELITKSQRRTMWNEIKRKAGITSDLRPYHFRHGYCCECFYRGLTVLKTAELMGTSPEMVMRVYTHLDNSKEPLGALLSLSI